MHRKPTNTFQATKIIPAKHPLVCGVFGCTLLAICLQIGCKNEELAREEQAAQLAAEKAVAVLSEAGVSATLYDVRCCAPLDPAMIRDAAGHGAVLTVEDGIRDGGIGAAIASQVHAISSAVPVESLGVPTQFIPHDKPDAILARFGLDTDGIVAAVRGLLS